VAAGGRRTGDFILLGALAAGATYAEAADQSGVSERTVHRRMADRAFRRRLSEVRGQMLNLAIGRLTDYTLDAVETLHELTQPGQHTMPGVRERAARTILDMADRLRQSAELEERVAALEAAAASTPANLRSVP
jgi:hypothetical protein